MVQRETCNLSTPLVFFMLDIKTFVCNLLSENTYVVSDETKE